MVEHTDILILEIENKPNLKLEYQWKPLTNINLVQRTPKTIDFEEKIMNQENIMADPKPTNQEQTEDITSKQKDNLISGLNEEHQKHIQENEILNNKLQDKMAAWVEYVRNEKENADKALVPAEEHLENVKSLLDLEDKKLSKAAQLVEKEKNKVSNMTNILNKKIEEAKEQNLEVRKSTGALASLNIDSNINPKEDESKRSKIKNEIDNLLNRVHSSELEALNKLEKSAQNNGLNDAENALTELDKVIELEDKLRSPHDLDSELRLNQEILNDKKYDLAVLQNESDAYENQLKQMDIDREYYERCLNEIRALRKQKNDANNHLEKQISDLDDKIEYETKSIGLMNEKLTPVKNTSLKPSRTLRSNTDKSRLAKAKMKIKLDKDDIKTENFQLNLNQLSSGLLKSSHNRQNALNNLANSEPKWKQKVNKLYGGVDDLYTPNVHEMNQRAEIHSLLDEIDKCKLRTQPLYNQLDDLNSELRMAEEETISKTRAKMESLQNSDISHINKMKEEIEAVKIDTKNKESQISSTSELNKLFDDLCKEKLRLIKLVESLEQKSIDIKGSANK